MPLTDEWFYLDCIFAIVREGLCRCHMGGLTDGWLPEPMRDWEFIEATTEEALALGCNTLCLAPSIVIVGAEHTCLIRAIEKRGGTVIPMPFDKPSQSNGGIRCSTHPLVRSDALLRRMSRLRSAGLRLALGHARGTAGRLRARGKSRERGVVASGSRWWAWQRIMQRHRADASPPIELTH